MGYFPEISHELTQITTNYWLFSSVVVLHSGMFNLNVWSWQAVHAED
jgi:hypothetical protein